jgi:hypothetical protein
LRTRSDVPIVNLASMETIIAKVNIEAKMRIGVIPAMPMFMRLNHDISRRAYRGRCGGRCVPEVRAGDADGKRPRRPARSAADLTEHVINGWAARPRRRKEART